MNPIFTLQRLRSEYRQCGEVVARKYQAELNIMKPLSIFSVSADTLVDII
jgi:hypothetical protein